MWNSLGRLLHVNLKLLIHLLRKNIEPLNPNKSSEKRKTWLKQIKTTLNCALFDSAEIFVQSAY